jgi:hypothetical protein
VNVWYTWRRRERALLNDFASVAQSCLLVPVVATVAGIPPARVLDVFLVCLAYFAGTVLYVKTMIRERHSVAYRRGSVGYHLVVVAAVAALGWWAVALFGWLAARAALLPGRGWSPRRVA